jgi:hypothetical protein
VNIRERQILVNTCFGHFMSHFNMLAFPAVVIPLTGLLKMDIAGVLAISRIESDFSYDLAFLRHSISRRRGYDIRTVQELLGDNDVKTTMIYTHVLNHGPVGFRSPSMN